MPVHAPDLPRSREPHANLPTRFQAHGIDTANRQGPKAVTLPGDVTDTAMAKKLVDDTVAALGGIDIARN
jgi:NAD(P)-dependent dehydrogenase (short-subunit alcohol dehydrogenase family)